MDKLFYTDDMCIVSSSRAVELLGAPSHCDISRGFTNCLVLWGDYPCAALANAAGNPTVRMLTAGEWRPKISDRPMELRTQLLSPQKKAHGEQLLVLGITLLLIFCFSRGRGQNLRQVVLFDATVLVEACTLTHAHRSPWKVTDRMSARLHALTTCPPSSGKRRWRNSKAALRPTSDQLEGRWLSRALARLP